MNIPLLDLKEQYKAIEHEIDAAIKKVLTEGQFILGPEVKKAEENVAGLAGVPYGIGVGNGTDALIIALRALGVGPGDEVITSPFTFFASAECISSVGAKPVFADIDPLTYCIDPAAVEAAVTARTRAIIPVHLFGHPADMDPIMDIAKRYNLFVVEDACQAIGASYKGRPVGSFGQAACFSFFPTKNLGGYGDGGMIVTGDEDLAEKMRLLRAHGSGRKYHHSMIGYNSRLDELQAALLNVKFKYIRDWNERRRDRARRYDELLRHTGIGLPREARYAYAVYHQYVVKCGRRDDLAAFFKQRGIGTAVYYPLPLHLQEVYGDLGYKAGDMPNAEDACRQVLAIPVYPELTDERQDYIVKAADAFMENAGA